jgi:hypothetical protein
MPAESARLRRSVGVCDRRFLGFVVAVVTVGAALAVVFGGHVPTARPGCLPVTKAGFMGGQTRILCGRRVHTRGSLSP